MKARVAALALSCAAACGSTRQLTFANASEWAFVGAPWSSGRWSAGMESYDDVMRQTVSSRINYKMATSRAGGRGAAGGGGEEGGAVLSCGFAKRLCVRR